MVEEEPLMVTQVGHQFILHQRYYKLVLASSSDEEVSKSELLKRRRRSVKITVKASFKVTNKIILLFHLDLDLRTTLGHSDLRNR